jgi:predicted Zn-dependent peptidase
VSKLSDILSNIEHKKLRSKLSEALGLLRKGDTHKLTDKFRKLDKTKVNTILSEMNSPDNISRLEQLKKEFGNEISDKDFDTIRQSLNSDECELVNKIQDIMK